MLEAGVVAAVLLFGAVVALVSAEGLLMLGVGMVGLGFAVGIPAAVVYHVKLYLGLKARGPVPRGWWVSPLRHHDDVSEQAERGFAWAFRLGAGGFGVIVLGCTLAALGLWKLNHDSGL